MAIATLTMEQFFADGPYNKVVACWTSFSEVSQEVRDAVYDDRPEGKSRDVLTPLKEGKEWLFELTKQHQPRTAGLLLSGGPLFVKVVARSGSSSLRADLALEVHNKVVVVPRDRWGWNLSDPGYGERIARIEAKLSRRDGRPQKLNQRQLSLPLPLREAYYTRFDGLNLPENVIAYPQRILPWGVTRPWESLEGYLKGLRAYKKYQPWFEERLPIKRLEDRKDIPLMAFLDTRRKLRQGDIFFVKNTIQDGVIYHIKDDVIEDSVDPELALKQAEVLGALAGFIFSGGKADNVNLAAAIAESGLENNYLTHKERETFQDVLAKCQDGDAAACATKDSLQQRSDEREKELKACIGDYSNACQQARAEIRFAAAEYLDLARAGKIQLDDDPYGALYLLERHLVFVNAAKYADANDTYVLSGAQLDQLSDPVAMRIATGTPDEIEEAVKGPIALGLIAAAALIEAGSKTSTGTKVGKNPVMPDATHKTLPPGYTRNADGSVMGPQGGRYSAVGTDLNGQRVYRDGGGRYYTLDGGTKVQVSNPASSPNVSITQQQAHHQGYVDDITGQLEGKGYSTTSGGFFSKCGSTVCYPDIIYSRPGSTRVDGVIEIKTGGAGPSTGQSAVYPQIGTGDAVPSSGFVQNWNESNPNSLLKAGVPMNQQGYPDGIPVYQITAPGLGQ